MFALSCADARGKLVVRKQLRRAQVLEFLRPLRPCVVGMEACGGAHHWARAIGKLGHEVRLMSPALVKPYRTGPNKHDRNDADAICEAVRRPQMRYVAVKSVAQQDLLALHRVRAQLMKQRIGLSNQLRALLHERGVVARLGAAGLRKALTRALVTERVQPGLVYTTFHHPESRTNDLTTEHSDWATNCPEFKVTAVQVAPEAGSAQARAAAAGA